MTLSEHEQRQLDEIELALTRGGGSMHSGTDSSWSTTAIRLLVGALVLTIATVLTFSESDGLTLLIGCGLLGTIVYLHRYDPNDL